MKILYASLLIFYYVNSRGQAVTLRQGSQELFLSEVIRVRRQAGYVYNQPSVSFDLPTRAPSLTVATQAPTVDRTQAQMMYYAYPAPAAGGNAVSTGASSEATVDVGGGGSTATVSAGISGGYNYGAQNSALPRAQSSSTTGFPQTGSMQSSSAGTSGYGYNAPPVRTAPVSAGSIQQSSNTGSSGYGYNAPAAGGAQVSKRVESTQTINAGSSKTGLVAGSGYEYNTPASIQGSGVAPEVEVSTNAPKYLPPTSGGRSSNNGLTGPVRTGGETSGTGSRSSPVPQPLDQYLPPLISKPDRPAAPVVDQYLPPNIQPDSPSSLVSSTLNKEVQSDTRAGPSSKYLPPNLGQTPLPVTNVTPRPFSTAPLSDGYIPPNANSQASAPNLPPTDGYLPPNANSQASAPNLPPTDGYLPPNANSQASAPNLPPADGYLPPVANAQASTPNLPSTPASPYLPPVL